MSKKSTIRRHVQTSVVARIIYRLICLALIVAGAFGLFMAFSAGDVYTAYTHRDSTATATVTKQTKSTDKYGYDDCTIEYKFAIDDKEYSSQTSWNILPNNYSCETKVDDQISIRYEAAHPTNNSYGDNEKTEALWLTSTIVMVILSVIPLGVGFVGLVAIHKALRAEDALEEAEAALARKRAYHRQAKKAAKEAETKE